MASFCRGFQGGAGFPGQGQKCRRTGSKDWGQGKPGHLQGGFQEGTRPPIGSGPWEPGGDVRAVRVDVRLGRYASVGAYWSVSLAAGTHDQRGTSPRLPGTEPMRAGSLLKTALEMTGFGLPPVPRTVLRALLPLPGKPAPPGKRGKTMPFIGIKSHYKLESMEKLRVIGYTQSAGWISRRPTEGTSREPQASGDPGKADKPTTA